MRVREDYRTLTGPEKAAILMLSIGEDQASRLFVLMDDEEIREVSQTMTGMGTVSAAVVERLFAEFSGHMPAPASLAAPAAPGERLLETMLGDGEAKPTVADESKLTSSLQNEHPQTAAVLLSKIEPEQSARILGQLPEALAQEVIMRMLRLESVSAASGVEPTPPSPDRTVDDRFLLTLTQGNRASAGRLAAVSFTFEDLGRLGPGSVQTLLRHVDRAKLALALKGASEPLRHLFYANLSERAGKKLREDIVALGPVKLREVDEAQQYMVTLATDLDARDEIALAEKRNDDELIY